MNTPTAAPAPTLPLFTEREPLLRHMEALATEGDTTFALMFLRTQPTAVDVALVREAAKICDRVVVAGYGFAPHPVTLGLLQKAGADALFMPPQDTRLCTLEVAGNKEWDASLMLQALLAVLPNMVILEKPDLPQLRVLRNIQQTFGEFFSLRAVE
ncbi:MAG: hypothetical protein WAX89_02875 [Alphaproteobacteria bacterium]